MPLYSSIPTQSCTSTPLSVLNLSTYLPHNQQTNQPIERRQEKPTKWSSNSTATPCPPARDGCKPSSRRKASPTSSSRSISPSTSKRPRPTCRSSRLGRCRIWMMMGLLFLVGFLSCPLYTPCPGSNIFK